MVLGAMLQDGTLVAQQKVADKGSEIASPSGTDGKGGEC